LKDKKGVMDEAYRILKFDGRCIVVDKYYLSWFEHYFKEILNYLFKHQ